MRMTSEFNRSARSAGRLALGVAALLTVGCQSYSDPVADVAVATNMRRALNKTGGETEEAAVMAEPTGFVDFAGSFKVNGQTPTMSALNVTSDQAVCAPGGKSPLEESVVVGPDNGLANVIVYLNTSIPVGNPAWEHESYAATREAFLSGKEQGFDQQNCVFLSHAFGMRSSQTLQILNSDPVGHNTNIAGDGRAGSSNSIVAAGQTATYAPGGESRQPFPVSCNIHPWMKAYMIVRDSPYFAVTQPNGEFAMPKVPAGVELEFRVWHERHGLRTRGHSVDQRRRRGDAEMV